MTITKPSLYCALCIKSEWYSDHSLVKEDVGKVADKYEENSKIKSIIIINEIPLFIPAWFNLYKDAIENIYKISKIFGNINVVKNTFVLAIIMINSGTIENAANSFLESCAE